MDLLGFLRKRDVGQDTIDVLIKEKIDMETVMALDDPALARYLPALGDRVALRRHCEMKTAQPGGRRKMDLLETLRKKMKMHNERKANESSEDEDMGMGSRPLKGNRNAAKNTRRIELGWMHNSKQVRTKKGGGTRKLSVCKDTDYNALLMLGKELFFPQGLSKKGPVEDFVFSVWDFKENEMPRDTTVGAMYDSVKMGMLRFYLSSLDIENFESDTEEEDKEACVVLESDGVEEEEEEAGVVESDGLEEEEEADVIESDGVEEEEEEFGVVESHGFVEDEEAGVVVVSDGFVEEDDESLIIESEEDEEVQFGPMDDSHYMSDATLSLENIPTAISPPDISRNSPVLDLLPRPVHSITFEEDTDLDDSEDRSDVPVSPYGPVSSNPPAPQNQTKVLRLRRVNIVEDMLVEFTNPDILNSPLVVRFIDENGVDASGVTRDAFSAFWAAFFENCANGEGERVPTLSPEYGKDQWCAVGRILAKGFKEVNYFPIQLSLSFAVGLVYGEAEVTAEMLMKSFLRYITEFERETIQAAVDGTEVNQEELLDILCRMGSHTVPSDNSVKDAILQVAHKQLIQDPKYALDVMAMTARSTLKTALPTVADLQHMYSEKRPTPQSVVNMLSVEVKDAAQSQTLQYLKLFIRSLDSERLPKFLRFVTGSDVVCVDKISVQFTDLKGLQRRPVAHTCGPLLQVPSTYISFTELRREFQSVLDSQWLRMDLL